MESRAKFLGHAIHPILVMFPAGLLLISLVFDALRLLRGDKKWGSSATRNIITGCITGWIAAIPGAVDWWHLPQGSRAKRVATVHAITNQLGLLSFLGSWLMRRKNEDSTPTAALGLSVLGATFIGLGGWLGGELVERLGVGVTPGANLDAPSSLTHPHWKNHQHEIGEE
jgi:uncharacterized membrane protein